MGRFLIRKINFMHYRFNLLNYFYFAKISIFKIL